MANEILCRAMGDERLSIGSRIGRRQVRRLSLVEMSKRLSNPSIQLAKRLYQNPTAHAHRKQPPHWVVGPAEALSWFYRIETNYRPEGRDRTGELKERSSSAIF
jgi:hypothetical protein